GSNAGETGIGLSGKHTERDESSDDDNGQRADAIRVNLADRCRNIPRPFENAPTGAGGQQGCLLQFKQCVRNNVHSRIMRRPVINGAPKPRWSTEIRSLGLFSTSGAAFEKSGLSCAKQMLGVKLEFELTP